MKKNKKIKLMKFYTRYCIRCNNFFKTTGKYSKICDKCKLPHWTHRVSKQILINFQKNRIDRIFDKLK